MNREYFREYRKGHKEELNANHESYRKRLRMKVLVHYGGNPPHCACCGEAHVEFLTVHHKNGGGSEHRRKLNLEAGYNFYRWLVKEDFPLEYQVLCFNCNCALGGHGFCPHEKEGDK